MKGLMDVLLSPSRPEFLLEVFRRFALVYRMVLAAINTPRMVVACLVRASGSEQDLARFFGDEQSEGDVGAFAHSSFVYAVCDAGKRDALLDAQSVYGGKPG